MNENRIESFVGRSVIGIIISREYGGERRREVKAVEQWKECLYSWSKYSYLLHWATLYTAAVTSYSTRFHPICRHLLTT